MLTVRKKWKTKKKTGKGRGNKEQGNEEQQVQHKDFEICGARVSTALQWLVANNPYYSHVAIDEEALQALEKGGEIHHFGKEVDEGEVGEAAQEIVAAADPLLAGLKHYPTVTDGDCFFDGLRGANPDIQDLRKKVGKYVDQDTFEQYELLHNTSLADLEEARGKLQDHLSTRAAGRPTKKWLNE